MAKDIDVGVDELLAVAEVTELDSRRNTTTREVMDTGSYDAPFFGTQVVTQQYHADHMEVAMAHLSSFLGEARAALKTADMSASQRQHVTTIVTYVEALSKRFDTIRKPGWGRDRKASGLRALARLMMGTLT